jgi:glycosyltransferase involved in cell wall biosynthesis
MGPTRPGFRRFSASTPDTCRKGRTGAVRTAIFSTYPPRACGIGTFAFDVRTSLLASPGVKSVGAIAIVDEASSPQRHDVLATVSQTVRGDYVRAARLLGRLDIDVVLLQHEYGIFGGADGEYVLSFVRELARPLVLTLHTVLSDPTDHQREVLTALCEEAERVIVMTETARGLLLRMNGCAPEKIRVIQHGAPAVLARRSANGALQSRGLDRLQSRFVLSTFGLISPGKGIETAIAALPAIVERHPEVLYLVAGRTHPEVARLEGEQYRLLLERRAVDLGVADHVEFDDRFLSVPELADLLHATDVFLTPYRNPEQIASGALTFAIAAGCAAISTPYLFAKDMLATGAGKLVPFDDVAAIGTAVCDFIESPESLGAARAEARRIGADLAWPSIAAETAVVLHEAAAARPRRVPIPIVELELTSVRTDHLRTLVDDVGIVQHATGVIPSWESGYCVDDVARLAVVALELTGRTTDRHWTPVLHRSLAFLQFAAGPEGSGMRNFMGYDRRWLDEPHVGDHVGRAIWALGEILATAWIPALSGPARRLLDTLVPSLHVDVSLRTAAYTVLGLARLDPDRLDRDARGLLERFVEQLASAYRESASGSWLWFEDRLAYDNARLPQALIVGGSALRRQSDVAIGLESLAWLGGECGLDEGMLRLPGHHGRGRDEPAPGEGDEQPLDATAFVEAELAALAATGDGDHGSRARNAFDWFLGRNRLDRPLYDFATGGCSDGLGETDLNANEGAESTLAFHRAQLLLDAAALPAADRRKIRAKAA